MNKILSIIIPTYNAAQFLDKGLSTFIMEDKEVYTSNENNNMSVPIVKNDNKDRKFNSQVVYPIISDGDVIRKCYFTF